jgi:hypothetical protein
VDQVTEPLDFLWIDGDHAAEQARRDVQNFGSKVRPNGVIALHDYWSDAACAMPPLAGPCGSEVSIVIDEMKADTNRYELITLPWSFGLTLARVLR